MRVPQGVLLAGWIILGAALATVAGFAWLQTEAVQGWIRSLQAAYGVGAHPAWPLRADAHVHLVVAGLVTLWLGVGCRLFAPRTLPWLPIALAILVALADELAQLGAASRTFEWSDQAADAIGILAALPLLLLLRRLELSGYRAATSSRASSRRS
jgi:hypothetical protein